MYARTAPFQTHQRPLWYWPFFIATEVFSFEFFFLVFLFVGTFKPFDPFPVDATVRFFFISVMFGIPAILRQGIYLPGLTALGSLWLVQLYAVIAWSWSAEPGPAYRQLIEIMVLNSWTVIAGAMIIAPNPERVRRIIRLLIFAGVLIAFLGLYYYFVEDRPVLFQFSYKHWAKVAAVGFILTFLYCLHSRPLSPRQLIFGGLAVLCFAYVFFSRGRMAFLASAMVCLLPILIASTRAGHRGFHLSWPQLIGLLGVLAGVGTISFMLMSGEAMPTVARILDALSTGSDTDSLHVSRVIYFGAAIDFWFQEPIFGIGFGSYSMLHTGIPGYGAYAHNLFLSILSELGLIGVCLFAVFLWSVFRHVTYQRLSEHPVMLGFFMLAMFGLLLTATDGHLDQIREQLFYLSLLCVRLPKRQESHDEDEYWDEDETDPAIEQTGHAAPLYRR